MRKGVYEISGLVFLSVFLLVFIINIWDGSVTGEVITDFVIDYGYCDYNISCGFENWSVGGVYCLNESQVTIGTCFNITNDSVTLDLQGFNITGGGDGIPIMIEGGSYVFQDYGIYVNGYDIIVTNGNLVNFSVGVFGESSMSTYSSLNLNDNNIGIYFEGCTNSDVENVYIFDTSLGGIFLFNSDGGSFLNIFSYDNLGYGVRLDSSDSNTFLNGVFYDNSLSGISLNDSNSNSFQDISSYGNTLSGIAISFSSSNVFNDVSSFDNGASGIVSDVSKNIFYNLNLLGNGENSTIGVDKILYNISENKKIEWDFGTNLTLNSELDFENNIDFGKNYVDVDISALPSVFNSSATITLDLSGSGITAPMPYVDGVFCEDDQCDIEDFDDNVTIFLVTHFSNYSFLQSSCGDAYCAYGESCSSCALDCGNCTSYTPPLEDVDIYLVNASNNESVVNESVVNDSVDGDFKDEVSEADEDEGGSFPWLWVFIGIGIGIFVFVFFIVIVIILNRKGNGVIMVSRPKDSSFGEGVGSGENVVKASSPAVAITPAITPVATSTNISKVKSKRLDSVIEKNVVSLPVSKDMAKQPILNVRKRIKRSVSLLPANIRYIKYYAQNISHNSKVRIKYLISNGEKFVKLKDYVNAKQIYSLIFEEYKALEIHDEEIYQKIVAFRKSIHG